jgi:predicted transposase YbfD/YdcC
MNWYNLFAEMPDFRLNRRKRHLLVDILVIALCAIISGADDFEEIEAYGQRKKDFLATFLDLPNGIPSHDTFNRVFRLMDTKAFAHCLHQWSAQLLALLEEPMTQINLDGKVLRGTAKSGFRKSGICLVSAWVSAHELVLGQEKVADKSNEKTAIPALLNSLDLSGALVSCDAAGTQLTNADLIVAKGGHYLLALKQDHGLMYEQVHDWMSQNKDRLVHNEHVDFGSGRIETRVCRLLTEFGLLDTLSPWTHLRTVIRIDSSRDIAGQLSHETRYYLSDLTSSGADFNRFVRHHWSIENRLHWKLDVVFGEDQQRVRLGNGATNMATARKMALQALNRLDDRESTKNRRKIAGWDNDYLETILGKMTPV